MPTGSRSNSSGPGDRETVGDRSTLPPACLDIDLDFFFYPRVFEPGGATVGKGWAADNKFLERVYEPADVARHLRLAGLRWEASTPTLLVTHHYEVLPYWRRMSIRGARVTHVDAHSDWYPALPELVHSGNFLAHAMSGRIFSEVRWLMPRWIPADSARTPWDIRFNGRRSVVTAGRVEDTVRGRADGSGTVRARALSKPLSR